jgi:hypothetical protein
LTDNLSANADTEVTLTIDKFYFSGFQIPYNLQAQSKFDIKADRLRAAGYGIAKQIDTDVATIGASFSKHIDAGSSAATGQVGDLVIANIIEAYTELNGNDVPSTDRQWVFDTSAYGEYNYIKFVK